MPYSSILDAVRLHPAVTTNKSSRFRKDLSDARRYIEGGRSLGNGQICSRGAHGERASGHPSANLRRCSIIGTIGLNWRRQVLREKERNFTMPMIDVYAS